MLILYDGAIERKKKKEKNQITQNPKTNYTKPKNKQGKSQTKPQPPTYITAYVIKVDLTKMFGIASQVEKSNVLYSVVYKH